MENNKPAKNNHPNIASTTNDPVLTVGMATHDDFDGVYFSVMSIVLYHKDILDQVEILVVDNNPDSKHGEAVRSLCQRVPQARYVAAGEFKGTVIRERIFSEAKGRYILGIDCHVFLHQDAIKNLIAYFETNPQSKDLLHGPLYYDNHDHYSTHMEPQWNDGFYGRWGHDPKGGDMDEAPFEIPLQGMGLYACVKDHWPGFNLKFRGFGGEEGYIHEKFRQQGGNVLCLPFLRWTHRFDRPNSPNYPNRWEDRIRNYLIGWNELGLAKKPVLEHFSAHLSFEASVTANNLFLGELNGPLWAFDTFYLLGDPEKADAVLRKLFIDRVTQPIEDESDLKRLIDIAISRKLPNVIIIDARAGEFEEMPEMVAKMLDYLASQEADIISVNQQTAATRDNPLSLHLISNNAFSAAKRYLAQNKPLTGLASEPFADPIKITQL